MTEKLISADKLKQKIMKTYLPADNLSAGVLFDLISTAPKIDAVEVVRCRECRYSKDWYISTDGGKCCYCARHSFTYGPNMSQVFEPVKRDMGYCSEGELMESAR